MGKSYKTYKANALGVKVDLDGFPVIQKYQCWDRACHYMKYVGGHAIHCGQTGYVKDIANQRATNGILDFCVDVGLKAEMQPGDIVVWTNAYPHCPDSHIAIYDHDNGQDEIYFLGQNQPNPWTTIARIPWQGIIGVFRPKIFVKSDPKPVITPTKRPDQILTVGSVCTSWGFYVEKLRIRKGNWEMYNSWVGGWIPCKDVDEVDALDGRKDQIVHVGSGCAFHGQLTVTKVDIPNDRAFIKELGYWVKCRCLNEIKEGR